MISSNNACSKPEYRCASLYLPAGSGADMTSRNLVGVRANYREDRHSIRVNSCKVDLSRGRVKAYEEQN